MRMIFCLFPYLLSQIRRWRNIHYVHGTGKNRPVKEFCHYIHTNRVVVLVEFRERTLLYVNGVGAIMECHLLARGKWKKTPETE